MLKIAVGTTSKFKVSEVNKALKDAAIVAEIFCYDTNTGVRNQPRAEKETLQGSINRAKEALDKCPRAEIGLGIEIGYEPRKEKWIMHGWASIIDHDGNIYSEQSSTLELPKHFYQFMTEQDEIGYYVQEYTDKNTRADWKYFAEIIQFRQPFIFEAVRNVILRYYFRNEY